MSRWYLFLLSYISAAKLTFIFHVLCGYLKLKNTKTCSWCPQNRFCQQKGNKRSNNFRTRTKDLIIENANEVTKWNKNVGRVNIAFFILDDCKPKQRCIELKEISILSRNWVRILIEIFFILSKVKFYGYFWLFLTFHYCPRK